MAQLPADQAVTRLQANEDRFDTFVNTNQSYVSSGGESVESLPAFLERKNAEIDSRFPDGFVNRGAFGAGVNYAVNDIVTFSGIAYLNVAAYTSNATTPNNDRPHWVVYQGVTEVAQATAFAARDVLRGQSSYGELQQQLLATTPFLRPSQAFIDALMSGTVNICVVGDSISASADEDYCNGWVQNFTQMLKQQIPWMKWNVTNLSIGGRSLNQLADPAYTSPNSFTFSNNAGGISSQLWPDGTPTNGKAWRDYVKDTAPDLIVLAHQENMGTDTNNLESMFGNFRDYTATWPKKPWFCLVSNFLPTKNPAINAGAWAAAQTGRQALADWLRQTAIYNGYGLIDNNAIFRILRDGKRTEMVPFTVEKNFRYFGNTSKWKLVQQTMPTLNGAVMTFTDSALIMRLGVACRDIDIAADFVPSATATTRIGYRLTDVNNALSGYSVQYQKSKGAITLYYGATVVGSWTVSAPTDYHNLRIKATGPLHELFYNGKFVASALHGTGTFAGNTVVGYAAGSGTISNLIMGMAQEEDVTPPLYNEVDIFGVYPGDVGSNLDTLGGDGIHHLSRKGIFLTYLPAVQTFVDELKKLFQRSYIVSKGAQGGNISAAVLPAMTDVMDGAVSFTLASPRWVKVDFALGYKNPGPGAGVMQLMLNGATLDAYYLECTTVTSGTGQTDPNPRRMAATATLLLGAGSHNIYWRWGSAGADAIMTSGGGGGTRYLSVTVPPA